MKKEEIVKIAIKGISAAIPFVGGTLISVWSDIESVQAQRKIERLEQFYIALEKDIEHLKNEVQIDYVNSSDFLDIFEITARRIVNERNEEKRDLFRNIFMNSIVREGCSYDKTEKYLRILEPMSSLEILILKILSNPQKYNNINGEIITDPNWISSGVRNGFQFTKTYYPLEMLSKLTNKSEEDTYESLYFMEMNRLIVEGICSQKMETNGHPISTIDDKLTFKGKDFISFIIR